MDENILNFRPISDWIWELFFHIPPKRVLFRVDAGRIKGLSFGHAARCADLAEALAKVMGSESLFLMACCKEGVEFVNQRGFETRNCATNGDHFRATTELINEFDPLWLVVDLPYRDLDWSFVEKVQIAGVKTLFIDDARFTSPKVDAVLNSSILAPQRFEKKRGIKYFLGPEYFIFNPPEYLSTSEKKESKRILLSFGGSDLTGLTINAAQALAEIISKDTEVHIVLGPGYRDEEKIRDFVTRARGFIVHRAPYDLYRLFVGADMVICAGGRTLYELICLGVPAFPIASIDHETPVVSEFIRKFLVFDGMTFWNRDLFSRKIIDVMKRYG